MKIKVKYLQTCQIEVPDGYGDVENCGEPAVVILDFDDGSSLFVCKEHFNELLEDRYYDFE